MLQILINKRYKQGDPRPLAGTIVTHQILILQAYLFVILPVGKLYLLSQQAQPLP